MFNKKQRDTVFYYSFFLGPITGIDYSSTFSWIVYRWWNILCLIIHMKMDCAIERIKLKGLLVKRFDKVDCHLDRTKKRWIWKYWVIWRDGRFVFGSSRLIDVSKMTVVFASYRCLVVRIININIMSSDADYFKRFSFFDIKTLIIVLIMLIPICVFLYQMFVKWLTVGCK